MSVYNGSTIVMLNGFMNLKWFFKAIEDYKVWNLDFYENIPKFLTNGKSEYVFNALNVNNYNLKPNDYINIVKILNRVIKHLNKNKEVNGENLIEELQIPQIPDDVQLKKRGLSYTDFYDNELMEYWNEYVVKNAEQYIRDNANE